MATHYLIILSKWDRRSRFRQVLPNSNDESFQQRSRRRMIVVLTVLQWKCGFEISRLTRSSVGSWLPIWGLIDRPYWLSRSLIVNKLNCLERKTLYRSHLMLAALSRRTNLPFPHSGNIQRGWRHPSLNSSPWGTSIHFQKIEVFAENLRPSLMSAKISSQN